MHINKGGYNCILLHFSFLFLNRLGSEQSKALKSGNDFNNSTLENSALVQADFGDKHNKSSTIPNLLKIITGSAGQLTLINSIENSSNSGLKDLRQYLKN